MWTQGLAELHLGPRHSEFSLLKYKNSTIQIQIPNYPNSLFGLQPQLNRPNVIVVFVLYWLVLCVHLTQARVIRGRSLT